MQVLLKSVRNGIKWSIKTLGGHVTVHDYLLVCLDLGLSGLPTAKPCCTMLQE